MNNSCPPWYSIPLPPAYYTGALTNSAIDPTSWYAFKGKLYSHTIISIQKIQSNKNKIFFLKFHFKIYRDLNATVFNKRFPAINILMKFKTEQNVCCRVLHCVRDEN